MGVLARRRLQAVVGRLECIGKGKRMHIVGPCEHLLSSYATKSVGRHEGTVLYPIIEIMGLCECISKGKRMHIVGPCEHLLSSYATKSVGRHEGTVLCPIIEIMGLCECLHTNAYRLLWADSSASARGNAYTLWAHASICSAVMP